MESELLGISADDLSGNQSPASCSPILGIDISDAQSFIEDVCDKSQNLTEYSYWTRKHVSSFLELFERMQVYIACIDDDVEVAPSGCSPQAKKRQEMKRLLNLIHSSNDKLQASGRAFYGCILSYKRLLEFEKYHCIMSGFRY